MIYIFTLITLILNIFLVREFNRLTGELMKKDPNRRIIKMSVNDILVIIVGSFIPVCSQILTLFLGLSYLDRKKVIFKLNKKFYKFFNL